MTSKFTFLIITSILLLLSACGGGGYSDGGIGGTGITQGRITGFGSIIVNGIRFDVSSATFTRDGLSSSGQGEFSLGEVVTITGTIDAGGVSGIATNVNFTDNVEGPVSTPPGNNTLEVLGQQVNLTNTTRLHGFNTIRDIQQGDILEVSGFVDQNNAIQASSLKLKNQTTKFEVKGLSSRLNRGAKTFSINNLKIDYSIAVFEKLTENQLHNGLLLEIEGTRFENGILVADLVEIEKEQKPGSGTHASIEGLITRFVDATDFDVNGQTIATNSQTVYEHGAASNLALNQVVEVEGAVNSQGVLIAREIKFKGIRQNGSNEDTEQNTPEESDSENEAGFEN